MRLLHRIILLAAAIICIPMAISADQPADDPTDDSREVSIADEMASPPVPDKAKAYVKNAIDQLRRYFVKVNMQAKLVRDGEVLKLTIPCADLFAPGATVLKPAASDVLAPFGPVVREPDKYKVIIAVHADDTGDDMYCDSITVARALAIDDYLWELASRNDTNVIAYGAGRDEYIGPNNSIPARSANRRVEFFIIPDVQLLRLAGVKVK